MNPLDPKSSGGGGSHHHPQHRVTPSHPTAKPVVKVVTKPSTPQPSTKTMEQSVTQEGETYDSLIMKLTARKEEWIRDYAGKVNYNPYLASTVYIDPLVKVLQLGQIPINEAIKRAMDIPLACPQVNPNYVPPAPEPSGVQLDPKQFGAKNVGQ
jgi:hypothetical protein